MSNVVDNEALLEKAVNAMADERYARACILFEKIPLNERPAEACFKLGQAYLKRKRFDQALKSFQHADAKKHDPAATHHGMGLAKTGDGNEVEALQEFEAALAVNPRLEVALLDAGRVHERLEDYDRALELYQRAAGLECASTEAFFCLANLFQLRGKVGEMAKVVLSLIERDPSDEKPYELLQDLLPRLPEGEKESTLDAVTKSVIGSEKLEALCLWMETLVYSLDLKERGALLFIEFGGKFRSEIQIFEDRLSNFLWGIGCRAEFAHEFCTVLNDLSSPVLHASWGACCADAENFDDLSVQFRHVLQQDFNPEKIIQIASHFFIGNIFEHDEIASEMARIVKEINEPQGFLIWAHMLLYAGKHNQAIALLNDAEVRTETPALNLELQLTWGRSCINAEQYGEAVHHLMEALKLMPEEFPDWHWLDNALWGLQEKSQWVDAIQEILVTVDNSDTLMRGAETLNAIGAPAFAAAHIEKALQYDPSLSNAYADLCEILPQLENRKTIINRLESLVKDSNNAKACREWAKVLDSIGQDEALSFLEESRELDPEDLESVLLLASHHMKGGRYEEAFPLHALAVELKPEISDVYSSWLDTIIDQETKSGVTAKLADSLGKTDLPQVNDVDWQDIYATRDAQLKELERFVSAIEHCCDDPSVCVNVGVKTSHSFSAYTHKLQERIYKCAEKCNLNDFWPVYDLGVLIAADKRYRQALETITRAHDLAQDSSDDMTREHFLAQRYRALILAAMQKHGEADRAYDEALKTGTGLTGDDDVNKRVEAYIEWADSLSSMQEYDRALEVSRSALTLAPMDYWAHFRLAWVYGEMNDYERAIWEYEATINIDQTHPYAHHNIADYWEQQGEYRQARSKWESTLKVYQAGLAKAIRDRNDAYCYNYGLVMAVLRKFDRAESLFKLAEILNPDDTGLQQVLLDLYLERMKEAKSSAGSTRKSVGWTTEIKERINKACRCSDPTDAKNAANPESGVAFHVKAQNAYQRAKKILSKRLSDDRDPQTLFELGALELLKGEYEAAVKALKESIEKTESIEYNPSSARTCQKLGEAYLALGRTTEAVSALSVALSYQPNDLALRTVLGRALLRAGNLDEAEREFTRVIEAAKFHVDAWLGLGEVYLEMAESKAARDAARTDEWYDQAIEALVQGIDFASSQDRPITVTAELDRAYYLLGFARIQLYEASRLLRDSGLVNKAQADFRKCLELNSHHIKARRALTRVKEQRVRGRTIPERSGPYLVCIFSFLLIGIALFGLLKGFVTRDQGMVFAPVSIEALKGSGLGQNQIDQLKQKLGDAHFASEEKLLGAAREILGDKLNKPLEETIRKGITLHSAERENFKVSEFATLIFGGLLFLIAGVYLPQLTSLRMAGFQLDKSASERVEPIRSLGISK